MKSNNIKKQNTLTQSRLKELLYYNSATGVFSRIANTSSNAKIGDEAGGMNKSTGYWRIRVDGVQHYAHRLAWLYVTGTWPESDIDHINHNKVDNRFINLRKVTHQENQKNKIKYKKNKSGVSGVRWISDRNVWKAQICNNGEMIVLGRFEDKFEAICVRKSAEKKYMYHENHGNITAS
jgi:hypothetical protein